MKYTLSFSHESKKDLEDIFQYFSSYSQETANSFLDKIFQKLSLVQQFPEMCPYENFLYYSERVLRIEKYKLYYNNKQKNIIQIIRIIHESQDSSDILI